MPPQGHAEADLAVLLSGVSASRSAKGAERPVLNRVDLALPRGSFTALLGPNGVGKSTLLAVLARELAPTAGSVQWAADLADRMAWLPQQPSLDTGFPISVWDTVMLGHWRELGAFGRVQAQHGKAAREALDEVGLLPLASRLIGELSAGQLQRLLFARLMLQNQAVVLLDEPFAAVDAETAERLMGVLQRWHRQGRTIVYATHDTAQAELCATHAVMLHPHGLRFGQVAEMLNGSSAASAPSQRGPLLSRLLSARSPSAAAARA